MVLQGLIGLCINIRRPAPVGNFGVEGVGSYHEGLMGLRVLFIGLSPRDWVIHEV